MVDEADESAQALVLDGRRRRRVVHLEDDGEQARHELSVQLGSLAHVLQPHVARQRRALAALLLATAATRCAQILVHNCLVVVVVGSGWWWWRGCACGRQVGLALDGSSGAALLVDLYHGVEVDDVGAAHRVEHALVLLLCVGGLDDARIGGRVRTPHVVLVAPLPRHALVVVRQRRLAQHLVDGEQAARGQARQALAHQRHQLVQLLRRAARQDVNCFRCNNNNNNNKEGDYKYNNIILSDCVGKTGHNCQFVSRIQKCLFFFG